MSSPQSISGLIDQRERFLHFVQRRVHDRAAAEDLLQSAYIRAVAQASSLREDSSASAWFFRILRNAIIDHYRRRAVEERLLEPLVPEHDAPAPPKASTSSVCHCISAALDKVKPAYREILRETDLSEDESGSLSSFAERSGISSGNAAVRVHRARHALRTQLSRHCGVCAEMGCLDCTCA